MRLRCRIDWTWFLQPGALPHDVGAAGDLATQREGGIVGQPHRGQVVGRQQPRQDRRVDLVGLDLGLGDRPGLLRVGHHHSADMALQQPRDRMGVAGRLQGHLIGGAQAVSEVPQCLRGGLDPARLPDHAVLPDSDLGELAVHVQADASAHPAPPFLELAEGAQAGKRHLRIRARSASGRVAGAAMY
jgi:hypothetical protein